MVRQAAQGQAEGAAQGRVDGAAQGQAEGAAQGQAEGAAQGPAEGQGQAVEALWAQKVCETAHWVMRTTVRGPPAVAAALGRHQGTREGDWTSPRKAPRCKVGGRAVGKTFQGSRHHSQDTQNTQLAKSTNERSVTQAWLIGRRG